MRARIHRGNAKFALSDEPENAALRAYASGCASCARPGGRQCRRLADELSANPFLSAPDVATLADLRARKDKF